MWFRAFSGTHRKWSCIQWGCNDCGLLGHNNTDDVNKPFLALLSNKISIKKISCGSEHSLLL